MTEEFNLDDHSQTIDFIIKKLYEFSKEFFGRKNIRPEKFIITGGIIPNLWDFHKQNFISTSAFSAYKQNNLIKATLGSESDIDIYSLTKTEDEFLALMEDIKVEYMDNYRSIIPKSDDYPYTSVNFGFTDYKRIMAEKVQFLSSEEVDPDKITKKFDFKHVQSYYMLGSNELKISVNHMKAINSKTLYQNPLIPLKDYRVQKWQAKGYKLA